MKVRRRMTVTTTLTAKETAAVSKVIREGLHVPLTETTQEQRDTALAFADAITLEGQFYDQHPIGTATPVRTKR